MEKEREPGTARFGNFINYYQFNPTDRRLKLVDTRELLSHFVTEARDVYYMLDIGCNTGDLTVAVYDQLSTAQSDKNHNFSLHALGIDIDSTLISRAKAAHTSLSSNIDFATCDIMGTVRSKQVQSSEINNYFQKNHVERFDLVCCFSVTLWIHLNNGDEGLKMFLKYVSKLARCLLIEPQPWKCYKSAVRRMKKSNCEPFEHYKELTWRESVDTEICTFLQEECGMTLCKKFGETEWERNVCLFGQKS